MLKRLIAYLVLPREITQFERAYLGRMNRVAGIFFALHVPLFAFVALINGTGAWLALGLTLLMVSGPMLAARVFENPLI